MVDRSTFKLVQVGPEEAVEAVVVAAVTVTVAGLVVDKTLSLVWLPLSIDKTCVELSKVIFAAVGVTVFPALSFSVAILVLVFIAKAGSAPIERDMVAVPAVLSYWAGSIIADNALLPSVFGVRLSDTVVKFAGINLIVNFTKETRFGGVPLLGSSHMSKDTVFPAITVAEVGSKERVVAAVALLVIFCLFCAI